MGRSIIEVRPLDLAEFTEQLRLEGCEWADEIDENRALAERWLDEHAPLIEDIEYYLPDDKLKGKPDKAIEWLGDRSNLLDELQDKLDKAGHGGCDIDNVLDDLIDAYEALEEVAEIMRKRGWLDEGGNPTIAVLDLPYNI